MPLRLFRDASPQNDSRLFRMVVPTWDLLLFRFIYGAMWVSARSNAIGRLWLIAILVDSSWSFPTERIRRDFKADIKIAQAKNPEQ